MGREAVAGRVAERHLRRNPAPLLDARSGRRGPRRVGTRLSGFLRRVRRGTGGAPAWAGGGPDPGTGGPSGPRHGGHPSPGGQGRVPGGAGPPASVALAEDDSRTKRLGCGGGGPEDGPPGHRQARGRRLRRKLSRVDPGGARGHRPGALSPPLHRAACGPGAVRALPDVGGRGRSGFGPGLGAARGGGPGTGGRRDRGAHTGASRRPHPAARIPCRAGQTDAGRRRAAGRRRDLHRHGAHRIPVRLRPRGGSCRI